MFDTGREKKPNIESIWCATANVKEDILFGEEHIPRKGTKHFRGGAKVYIASVYGGMCNDATVIRHHRSNGRFILLTMPVKNLENFRLQLTYSPKVIELINTNAEKQNIEYTKEYAEYLIMIIPQWIEENDR